MREWLRGLSPDERKEIGSDIRLVQWHWPIGKPLVDGLGSGLYEVRTVHRGAHYRVLFCIEGGTMVLLHGFRKKTPAMPPRDLALARRRQRDVERDR